MPVTTATVMALGAAPLEGRPRRCESSAAVALAAAAETAADFAERREYQTASTDPAAATIETTSAAMTTMATVMALQGDGRGPAQHPATRTSASYSPVWCNRH